MFYPIFFFLVMAENRGRRGRLVCGSPVARRGHVGARLWTTMAVPGLGSAIADSSGSTVAAGGRKRRWPRAPGLVWPEGEAHESEEMVAEQVAAAVL